MPRTIHHHRFHTRDERIRGLVIHFGVYLAVNIGLAALNLTRNPHHLWFYWVAGGWGIGVILHALLAFRSTPDQPAPSRIR